MCVKKHIFYCKYLSAKPRLLLCDSEQPSSVVCTLMRPYTSPKRGKKEDKRAKKWCYTRPDTSEYKHKYIREEKCHFSTYSHILVFSSSATLTTSNIYIPPPPELDKSSGSSWRTPRIISERLWIMVWKGIEPSTRRSTENPDRSVATEWCPHPQNTNRTRTSPLKPECSLSGGIRNISTMRKHQK